MSEISKLIIPGNTVPYDLRDDYAREKIQNNNFIIKSSMRFSNLNLSSIIDNADLEPYDGLTIHILCIEEEGVTPIAPFMIKLNDTINYSVFIPSEDIIPTQVKVGEIYSYMLLGESDKKVITWTWYPLDDKMELQGIDIISYSNTNSDAAAAYARITYDINHNRLPIIKYDATSTLYENNPIYLTFVHDNINGNSVYKFSSIGAYNEHYSLSMEQTSANPDTYAWNTFTSDKVLTSSAFYNGQDKLAFRNAIEAGRTTRKNYYLDYGPNNTATRIVDATIDDLFPLDVNTIVTVMANCSIIEDGLPSAQFDSSLFSDYYIFYPLSQSDDGLTAYLYTLIPDTDFVTFYLLVIAVEQIGTDLVTVDNWTISLKNISLQNLGIGYGYCSTALATLAKTATISNYRITIGGLVAIKFTYSVPANSTLNITSTGAKSIYYKGAAIQSNIIQSGDTALFVYTGTAYELLTTTSKNSLPLTTSTDYIVSTTAASTTTKTATLSGFALPTAANPSGRTIAINFINSVPANAKLNISSTGARNIICNNANVTANTIQANDVVTLESYWNSSLNTAQYIVRAIDRNNIRHVYQNMLGIHNASTESANGHIYESPTDIKGYWSATMSTGSTTATAPTVYFYNMTNGFADIAPDMTNQLIGSAYVEIGSKGYEAPIILDEIATTTPVYLRAHLANFTAGANSTPTYHLQIACPKK